MDLDEVSGIVDFSDYEETKIPCPYCGENLSSIALASGPDDYVNEYRCFTPLCGYIERP